MRLVHTADVHLDACFAGSGMTAAFGNRRRQSLRDVFHNIVQRAAQWPADALLIAGDLFEGDRVSRDTVAYLQTEFEAVRPLPVFIAPGNHDPYVPTSPYALASWSSNVHIFDGPAWRSHLLKDKRLVVHGFAFDGPDISTSPFGTLQITPRPGWVQVAVAHGSERGHQPADKQAYAPFDAQSAAVDGLAYLALGHFHAMTPIAASGDKVIYYSGAPEGHNFRETGMHHYLEVEIDDAGVRVAPAPSAQVVYSVHTVDCSNFATAQQIVDSIRARAAAQCPQVARITLVGLCAPGLSIDSHVLYDAVASEFEYLHLVDHTEPMEDYEDLAQENTCLGVFIARMNQEVANAMEAGRQTLVQRAREAGLAAYRQRGLAIWGLEEE